MSGVLVWVFGCLVWVFGVWWFWFWVFFVVLLQGGFFECASDIARGWVLDPSAVHARL